jgi:hypothetical protein
MGWFKKIIGGIKKGIKKGIDKITGVVKKITSFVGDAFGFVIDPMSTGDNIQDLGSYAEGIKATKTGTNVSIPVVYGYRRVGGSIIFVESAGENNKYLYVAYAICEGPIRKINAVYIDDKLVANHDPNKMRDSLGSINVTGVQAPTSGDFKDLVQYEIHRGGSDGTRSTILYQAPSWKNNWGLRQGVKLTWAAFRFEYKTSESNPFTGGVPRVSFDVLGREVEDIRNPNVYTPGTGTLTADYSEEGNPLGDGTRKFDYRPNVGDLTAGYNPANALLDYLLNPRYGCGLKKSQIDAESFYIAANKFSQDVDYTSELKGKAMTCNAVINTGESLIDNVKQLLTGCRGILPYVKGRYKLVVDDGGNATDITSSTVTVAYDVDDNEFIGPVTLSGESKGTKYNKVIVNYVEPEKDFSSQQAIYSVEADVTADGEDFIGEFTFPTLTNVYIARELARTLYQKSRSQRSISFTTTQELMDVIPGDIIRVTDQVIGLNQQTFRVVTMKMTDELQIQIDAVEHDAALYPFVSGTQIEQPPRTFLPSDPYPKPSPTPIQPGIGTWPPVKDPPADPDPGPNPPPPPPPPPTLYEVDTYAEPKNFSGTLPFLRPYPRSLAEWNAVKTANSFNTNYSTPLYLEDVSPTQKTLHHGSEKVEFNTKCPLLIRRYEDGGTGGPPYNFETDPFSGVSAMFNLSGGAVWDYGLGVNKLALPGLDTQLLYFRMSLPLGAFDSVEVEYSNPADGQQYSVRRYFKVVEQNGFFPDIKPYSYGYAGYVMDDIPPGGSAYPGDVTCGGINLPIFINPNVTIIIKLERNGKKYDLLGDFSKIANTTYTGSIADRTITKDGKQVVLKDSMTTFVNYIKKQWSSNVANPVAPFLGGFPRIITSHNLGE